MRWNALNWLNKPFRFSVGIYSVEPLDPSDLLLYEQTGGIFNERKVQSMPIETIISLVVAVAALMFTAMSFKRNEHKDTANSATEQATMTADIRYIRSSVDDIKLENKAIQRDLVDIRERVVAVEQSTKSAHNRIDEIMQKG